MAEILVTGGAGYIGSHTILELFEKTGFDVISIDNFSRSSQKTYARIQEISGRDVTEHPFDICETESLKKTFSIHREIAGVIHFAAYKSVPESLSKPLDYYSNNINSLINLLRICRDFKVNNFIFSSSCSVYGNTKALPVTEDTPFEQPESPYAHTKQIGEAIMKSFSRSNPGFKGVSLRYFNPAGAHESGLNGELPIGNPSNLVPAITQFAAGKIKDFSVFGTDYSTRDGSCIRDFIHVSDIANAHVKALEFLIDKRDGYYDVFNLGTGNGVSVFEAIRAFEKVTGKKLDFTKSGRRAGDVVEIFANNNKAKDVLNWAPKRDIEAIMATAWKWEQQLPNLHPVQ